VITNIDSGQFRIESLSHNSGINPIIGKGSFEINIEITHVEIKLLVLTHDIGKE